MENLLQFPIMQNPMASLLILAALAVPILWLCWPVRELPGKKRHSISFDEAYHNERFPLESFRLKHRRSFGWLFYLLFTCLLLWVLNANYVNAGQENQPAVPTMETSFLVTVLFVLLAFFMIAVIGVKLCNRIANRAINIKIHSPRKPRKGAK